MARYSSAAKEGMMTASLELDGWDAPHTWEGDTVAPEQWPEAAVQSLIHLFTGTSPAAGGTKGTGIPEGLAHHIAVLIEDWCNLGFETDAIGLMCPNSQMQAYLNGDVQANLQYGALMVQREAYRSNHIQTWYSQGMALLEASWAPETDL